MTIGPDGTSVVSHQTVRLTCGSHRTPADGACVMELASMLAGEGFSDHPRAVCPVIAAFLRTYNDSIDDDARQNLYPYAAKVVGTRGGRRVRRARARRCRRFSTAGGQAWPLLAGRWSRERAAVRAALAAADPCAGPGHEAALAFVDELISTGASGAYEVPAAPPHGGPVNTRPQTPGSDS